MELHAEATGFSRVEVPDPCLIVIFGITGDLAHKDLIPALYSLYRLELLPRSFGVIGFARRPWTDETLRKEMESSVRDSPLYTPESWGDFSERLHYVQGNFTDSYEKLAEHVESTRKRYGLPGNILFHLSTPPNFYGTIIEHLGAVGLLNEETGWRRVMIEKPFGMDESSARALDRAILSVVEERNLYRVDHFLGKETVQNMLVFRFANPGFEPIWNRHYIDHVQITAAESSGIGTRGEFYEPTGVIRDMLQNHLLQLLCLTAMEPPIAYNGDALRDETVKVLRSARPIDVERDLVLGQYGAGRIDGTDVPGYRQEAKVAPNSITPTYVATKVWLDSWRWAGVPFYLRTGKRLPRKLTTIEIHFKPTPHLMFPGGKGRELKSSVLSFELQPDEGIHYRFLAKRPGPEIELQPVTMQFCYDRVFGIEQMPSAYQWLILDALQGDQTLFPRSDWIYAAWSIVDPLVAKSETVRPDDYPNYAAGSWGPSAGDELLRRDGRQWSTSGSACYDDEKLVR